MIKFQNSPIFTLEYNITWAFENASPYSKKRLSNSVAAGLINPEIGLHCDYNTAPPKGPFLQRSNDANIHQMHVSLKHLELLWSFIYAWMVIYERGIQVPLIAGNWTNKINVSDSVLRRALQLRNWSASLRTQCTAWPQDLPSPNNYACNIEQWYGEKTNLVFQQAVAFLLGHEYAHASGNHLNFITTTTPDIDAIEVEKEADVAAFESLIECNLDDSEKLSKAWSILSALLSSIYLNKEIRTNFVQHRHPNLHHRLSNFMRMLDFKDERLQYYFPMLSLLILDFTLEGSSLPSCSLCQYEDAQEAFNDILDRIDIWVK